MEQELQQVNLHSHLAEWSRRVKACRKSGQRISEWCGEHGTPVSTHLLWYLEGGQLELSTSWVEQALRDRVQELSLCQYSAGCPGPRGDLQQPDCDSQRNRAGSLPLSDLGFGNCSNTGSHLRGLGCAAAPS